MGSIGLGTRCCSRAGTHWILYSNAQNVRCLARQYTHRMPLKETSWLPPELFYHYLCKAEKESNIGSNRKSASRQQRHFQEHRHSDPSHKIHRRPCFRRVVVTRVFLGLLGTPTYHKSRRSTHGQTSWHMTFIL